MNFFDTLANFFRPMTQPFLVLFIPNVEERVNDTKNTEGFKAFNEARNKVAEESHAETCRTTRVATAQTNDVNTGSFGSRSGGNQSGASYSQSNLNSILTNALYLNLLHPFFNLWQGMQDFEKGGGKWVEGADKKLDGNWCSRPANEGHVETSQKSKEKEEQKDPSWSSKSVSSDGGEGQTPASQPASSPSAAKTVTTPPEESAPKSDSKSTKEVVTEAPVAKAEAPVATAAVSASSKSSITINPDQWKLTLPTDKNGGTTGTAHEIKGEELNSFSNKDYYFDKTSGQLVMTSSVDAARTSENTKYGRMELRERIDGEDAGWRVHEGGALSATLSVDAMSEEKDGDASRVVVGQIHGKDDELTRLYYDSDGEVYFANEITGSDGEERLFNFENAAGERPNIGLGEEWSYKIEVKDGKLDVAVEVDGEVFTAVPTDGVDPADISEKWEDDTFYFKAGVYNQVNTIDGHEAEGTGATTASFSALDVGHGGTAGLGAWTAQDLTWQ